MKRFRDRVFSVTPAEQVNLSAAFTAKREQGRALRRLGRDHFRADGARLRANHFLAPNGLRGRQSPPVALALAFEPDLVELFSDLVLLLSLDFVSDDFVSDDFVSLELLSAVFLSASAAF